MCQNTSYTNLTENTTYKVQNKLEFEIHKKKYKCGGVVEVRVKHKDIALPFLSPPLAIRRYNAIE